MNELVVADRASEWRRLKALVLDSVSSPITKRVYNLGLDEFIAWYTAAPRPAGFTKATVMAWRVALEARGLGSISINVRITAVRKLAVEASDNGLLAPELASGIARIKGVRSHGIRVPSRDTDGRTPRSTTCRLEGPSGCVEITAIRPFRVPLRQIRPPVVAPRALPQWRRPRRSRRKRILQHCARWQTAAY